MRRLTTEEFISRAKNVHGDKYDYSLVEYINNSTKVKIICKTHGIFEQTPNKHINRGFKCSKCRGFHKTTEQFIKESKLIHGDLYDYSLVKYTKSNIKVDIICRIHGAFKQCPSSHLAGSKCNICANNIRYSTEDFINKSIMVHGDKYDYTYSKYINNHTKIDIICKEHGLFRQTPYFHMNGGGCMKCDVNKRKHRSSINPTGWNKSNWNKSALVSKKFDSFKVYIIRCWNDNEEFYKVGRTFVKINRRFSGKTNMPYKYEVIKEMIFDTAKEAFDKETELKRTYKKYKYVPLLIFRGMQECFKLPPLGLSSV